MAEIVKQSGISMQTISAKMNRSRSFISMTIRKGGVPQSDTLAEVANICGYDLILRKRDDGTEIIIDPPVREKTQEQREYDELLERQKAEREAFKKRKK